MNSNYQPGVISQYFDDFGEQEWDRLVLSPVDEVSLYIHKHYLEKYLVQNQFILEIGAGAGRFTQIMSELDVQIVVADISKKQLEINQKFAEKLGFDKAVKDWQQMDICDLSAFEPGSFDAVVAYGGPFSYILDQRDVALTECLRVLKPGGLLCLSVMSLWGSAHRSLDGVLGLPPEANQKIISTGDLTPDTYPGRSSQFMHLFRAKELLDWLGAAGLTILEKSASNCLSLTWSEKLKEVRDDPQQWNELLRMELEACANDGCLDMGTHIIGIAQKK